MKVFGKNRLLRGLKPDSEEMSLQITSMADVFVILLVFLLKSSSLGLSSVASATGVALPEARAETRYPKVNGAPRLEIRRDAVRIDEKTLVQLHDFRFAEDEGRSEEVYQALLSKRASLGDTAPATDSHIVVLADAHTPYATLKTLMGSAAAAGYVDLQLAVVESK